MITSKDFESKQFLNEFVDTNNIDIISIETVNFDSINVTRMWYKPLGLVDPRFVDFKRAAEIVELIVVANDLEEVKSIIIKASKETTNKRFFLSHLNSLMLNVMLNRVTELGPKAEENASYGRKVTCSIIENDSR